MQPDLRTFLVERLPHLEGEWVAKRSSYEPGLCDALGVRLTRGRYCDAEWCGYWLEFKKGTSIWLDLVRYSEMLLGENEEAKMKTHCLFLVPDTARTRIREIMCVESSRIIEFLHLTPEWGRSLLALQRLVPRQLNAQASLTLSDVRRIRLFSVP